MASTTNLEAHLNQTNNGEVYKPPLLTPNELLRNTVHIGRIIVYGGLLLGALYAIQNYKIDQISKPTVSCDTSCVTQNLVSRGGRLKLPEIPYK